MSGADKDPAVPDSPRFRHIGEIVRFLREATLTRRAFGEQVKISDTTIRSFEEGRIQLTTAGLRRVLAHPAMRDLPALAAAASIELKDQGDQGGGPGPGSSGESGPGGDVGG